MSAPYYRLAIGEEVPHKVSGIFPPGDLGILALAPKWPSDIVLKCNPGSMLPDYFESGGRPVVSPRFRSVCETFRTHTEFLNVSIALDGRTVKGFCVMHPLERVDCIDYAASSFERYGTAENFTIKRPTRLIFRDGVIGERHLFRPVRYPALYVSSELQRALVDNGLVVGLVPLNR